MFLAGRETMSDYRFCFLDRSTNSAATDNSRRISAQWELGIEAVLPCITIASRHQMYGRSRQASPVQGEL